MTDPFGRRQSLPEHSTDPCGTASKRLASLNKASDAFAGWRVAYHLERFANYGLSPSGILARRRDPLSTDTLVLHRATRRIVETGIGIRREIPAPLFDLRRSRIRNLLKFADILDRLLQSSRTASQKRAMELQRSRNLRLILWARRFPSNFFGTEMLWGP